MADVNRTTVDYGVLHHAVTPLWENKSKAELAQWFSDNGFARAYGSNPANWSGLYNPFTGARSYSQTHAVGQRVTSATPDATDAERAAGYRVFYIVKDPEGQITWHAGNWTMNRRSIAIENLGDYRNYDLRDGDLRVIADFYRPLDQKVGGRMDIIGHQQVYATACPANIMKSIPQIINYINNPPSSTKPVPAATKLTTPLKFTAKLDKTEVWDLTTNPNYKSTKTLNRGDEFIAHAKIDFNGTVYYVTEYSFGKGNKHGVNQNDLVAVATDVITKENIVVTEMVDFTVDRRDDSAIPKGEEVVVRKGVDGKVEISIEITYTNGKETSRREVGRKVTEPISQIVSVGTRESYPSWFVNFWTQLIDSIKSILGK